MTNNQRWNGILTDQQLAEIESLGEKPPAPAIRLNTLKITPELACAALPDDYGWQVQLVPFCPTGWRFTTLPPHPISRTLEYRMGFYYIQDMASMLPAEMFSPVNGDPLILDMAAAPGGKTTHLLCKSDDRGLTLANDVSGGRIGMLLSNLRRWGATSCAVANLPGERLGEWLPDAFDRVLLDAPCSGENLRTDGGSRGRSVSRKERSALHDRQVRLLARAFHAAKPGGEIVYATCTVAPEEDESVLDEFLRAFPQAEIARPPHLADLPNGITAYEDQELDPRVSHAIRLWPHQFDTGSFFAALIRKRESVAQQQEGPAHPHSGRGMFTPASSRDHDLIAASLHEAYGVDLPAILDDRGLELWNTGKLFHAIPSLLSEYFGDLPIKAAGMLVGEMGEGRFVPSHEFVSRFWGQFVEGKLALPEDRIAGWLAGGEIRGMAIPAESSGKVVLLQDSRGRFLGRGKPSAGRVRNLLPAGF